MRRFLGQQLGAFVYKDPPVQIANHSLSESAAVFWTHTAGGTTNDSPEQGIAATITGLKFAGSRFWAEAGLVYWGDSNTSTFSLSGALLNHTYPNSGPKDTPKFTEGVITETSNHYMNKTFIRGSSKVLEKLI